MYHSHLGFRFRGQITPLEHEESYKDLGVTCDEKLSFRDHIYDKVHKAYVMLGIIKRNFKYISINSFILLYKSMVRSLLDYCVQYGYLIRTETLRY